MCPHVPLFPPEFDDWKPGNPFDLEPPLPRWTFNPITPEQYVELERLYGRWAARRTVAMASPAETFETIKTIARSMYESYKARILASAPAPARRARRVRAPTMAEELAPAVGILTPELETKLVDAALELVIDMRQRQKREMRTEEKQELGRAVVDWAEEAGAKLTEEQGMSIVNMAITRFAPTRT